MLIVTVRDEYPEKCHDWKTLFLVKVEPRREGEFKEFLTGFRPNPNIHFGLFDRVAEPIQVLKEIGGVYWFTMRNMGDIPVSLIKFKGTWIYGKFRFTVI